MPSFYSLDDLIELNEKRLDQYSIAYHKSIDKFPNLLVIYSALAIFLIPIVQVLFYSGTKCLHLYYCSFFVFLGLFMCSLFYTIKLLIPVRYTYLMEPKIYYEQYRLNYETYYTEDEVDDLIKSSYIDELEKAVENCWKIFKRKELFYFRAFTFALLACIPYLICLGFQVGVKEDKVQKVEIVNNFSKFIKTNYMEKDTCKKSASPAANAGSTRPTTNLPGVDRSRVIPSSPYYFKVTLFSNPEKSGKLKNNN